MGGSASTPAKQEDETKVVAEADPVIVVPDIDKLLDRDPYLKLHETEIRRRYFFFRFTNHVVELNLFCLNTFISGMVFLTS
jgi:hypothetical protein